jgi:hypothetical protein
VIYPQIATSPRVQDISWSKRQEIHLDEAYLTKG